MGENDGRGGKRWGRMMEEEGGKWGRVMEEREEDGVGEGDGGE